MSERLKILKLLEEGKINADEASRLLEALSHSESGHKKQHRMWAAFEHIPESIATMINGSIQHMASPEELRFNGKDQLEIKAISGDLIIQGTEQNEILISKDGFGRVKEKDDKIEIKAISGDIHAQIPKQTKILIRGVSGAITISNMENEILLKTVSGNVIGKNLKGSFSGNMIAGDLVLDFIEVKDLNIRSRSGDVTLYLDDQIDAHINIETEEGEIFCDLPLQNEEKNEFTLKGNLKTGKGNIEIKCDLGDTHLKRRESKVTN